MKRVRYALNDKVVVEAEGETMVDVFEELAELCEVMVHLSPAKKQNHPNADNAGKTFDDVVPVVRVVEDNKFYEFRSRFGSMKKPLGVAKKGGGLFPKLKDADGNYLPDNGWRAWDGEKEV